MTECCPVGPSDWPEVLTCPVTGRAGKQVDALTVRSLVRQLPLGIPPTAYYFCDDPGCDVVYFPGNRQAPLFRRADLWVRVGVKENEDPVPECYCFGFTRQDIADEMCTTGRSTVAERIAAESRAGNCACELKNPSGKCCLGEVTRVVQECNRGRRRTDAGHCKLSH